MIKSAIMTSADITGKNGKPIVDQLLQPYNLFATDAGVVNPAVALNPGLVFDIEPNDYISYLCRLGYSDKQISAITSSSISCSSYPEQTDLNYPSITVSLDSKGMEITTRVLKNVGHHVSVYRVSVMEPPGVKVVVTPSVLRFSASSKVQNITVMFQGELGAGSSYASGFLKLTSKHNVVRCPLLLVSSSTGSSNHPTRSVW
ncbi:Peptidase S8 subtilisin-related protein [Dioscorea alata]|uniref:Peptidase S8 subtilisin-related protein n=1 Tax=Dioscorea alata TaxID=55571 RepID=A0ACB7WL11_DIOAL|nr:Peptidase S8 subtilisin-related protein [Dioscorea alata]